MGWDPKFKPRLRPVEAIALSDSTRRPIALRDRSGLSDAVLTVSAPSLHILTLLDGQRSCADIQRASHARFGQPLDAETFQTMLDQLEQAHFLEGPGFEAYYQSLQADYRSQGMRTVRDAAALGIEEDCGARFDEMLAESAPVVLSGPVVGVVAPHLDYGRGRPCYGSAYATLRKRDVPDRVVLLGTNHFGHADSVVATGNDFATPLGTTRTDVAFLERVEAACGNLRSFELDHAREHSIELQLAWLQHLWGAGDFEIVSFLCPDPCGPNGMASHDGQGVDLRDFARALGDRVADDPHDTLIVAGADLSHVGAAFGEDPALDDDFLERIRKLDLEALELLQTKGPDAFVHFVAEKANPTRICSAGCIFAIAVALPGAGATILRYHQAVDQPSQTSVSCTAVAFT